MIGSRVIGKKPLREPMSKWGFPPPNGPQIFKNYLQILQQILTRYL